MDKFVKAVAAASLILTGSLAAAAQSQNPNADPRPLPPDGMNQQPYAKDKAPTNPPTAAPSGAATDQGVGSRPLTPGGHPGAATTEPADKGTTNLKKLDNQGRGGQEK